jgi:hypothetical protein
MTEMKLNSELQAEVDATEYTTHGKDAIRFETVRRPDRVYDWWLIGSARVNGVLYMSRYDYAVDPPTDERTTFLKDAINLDFKLIAKRHDRTD